MDRRRRRIVLSGSASLETVQSAVFGGGEDGLILVPVPVLQGQQILFQDSAGTTPVTADGDPVGLWKDVSGNGRDAVQATDTDRLIYHTDGKTHWVSFDGANQYMDVSSLPASSNPTMSVVSHLAAGKSRCGICMFNATTNVYGLFTFGTEQATHGFNTWNNDTWGIANSFLDEKVMSTLYFLNGDPSVVDVSMYINGGQQSLSQIRGSSASRTISTGVFIGRGDSPGTELFKGDIYGIIISENVLTTSQRLIVESYLATQSRLYG